MNREIKVEIKTGVYGKRQTSDAHLRFLKMKNTYARMVQNNSHFYSTKLLAITEKTQTVNGK